MKQVQVQTHVQTQTLDQIKPRVQNKIVVKPITLTREIDVVEARSNIVFRGD